LAGTLAVSQLIVDGSVRPLARQMTVLAASYALPNLVPMTFALVLMNFLAQSRLFTHNFERKKNK
jgi:hypothetical protein